MKHLFATLVSLITLGLNAQTDKNLGDFTELKATQRIKIELIPSSENKIQIDSKDENSVSLTNKNGRLIIKNTLKELVSEDAYNVSIRVYFKELNAINAESGSYIFSKETLKSNSLKLTANLGAKIDLKLTSDDVEAKVFTGATMNLEGSAKSGNFIANAGGTIKAKDLKFEDLSATVNAGGKLDVTASNSIKATTRAGGNINIYGNPESVIEKTTAGGNINRIK